MMKVGFLLISIFLAQVSTRSFVEQNVKSIPCALCHKMVKGLQSAERFLDKDVEYLLEEIAMAVCVGENMFIPQVCRGAIHEMTPTILESIVARYITAEEICPFIKWCPPVFEFLDKNDYIQEVIKDKSDVSEWPQVQPGGKTVKIIHMSDLHFDRDYKEGSKANCNLPLCCREESGQVQPGDQLAGEWGTLASCNIPERTLDQLFQFFKTDIYNEEDRFLLLWTGDNVSHDIWEQSKQKNLESTRIATNLLKKYFDGASNIEIIPQSGNHEAFPVNVFDFKSEREIGFRSELADLWREFIGDDAANQLQQHGFYKYEPKGLNLKIIAYDTQVCNSENWYLIKDPTDPSGFLEWARQELYDSERRNQAVYMASHQYSRSCLDEWASRYIALVDRFSHIIRAQIHGHAHGEFFNLYRGYKTNETLGVAWVSSSVTTYSNLNPSFRVFVADQETMIPLNYYQYRLDLDAANKNHVTTLKWQNVFNFLEEYGAKSMRPKDIEAMVERVLTEKELAQKFEFNENSGNGWVENPNQRGIYCDLMSSLDEQESVCNTGSVAKQSIEQKITSTLQGPWKKRIN